MMKAYNKKRELIKVIKQRNVRLFLCLAVLLLILLPTSVQSQSSDMLAHDELLIRNGTNRQIKFFIRKGGNDWLEKKLNPRDSKIYKDIDQLWVEGDHRRLELQRRYKIVQEGDALCVKEIVLR